MKVNEFLLKWEQLQNKEKQLQQAKAQLAKDLSEDPIQFCKEILGFTPFDYQKEFITMFRDNQFTAARWSRQSGKTYIISALLLWYATTHPKSAIGIIGPSWRQTKFILKRIGNFAKRLPEGIAYKPQKTQLHFFNESTIEAYPNNPETIRGPSLNVVYCDEFNFIANGEDLYDASLYTLGATDGKFVCSSTPWHIDSMFHKIFHDPNFSDFKTSHVPVERATEPNGPLKQNILDKIKHQMKDDPSRWRREMEAEWAEQDDVWLTQSIIAQCIGTTKNCGIDLREYDPEISHDGYFFAGLDLAQTRDYSVLSVIEQKDAVFYLRHIKIFKHPTEYANVIGTLKALQDRWGGFQKIRVDITREGPSLIKEMENAGISASEGVIFSVPRKSEMANLLRRRMSERNFLYPLLNWERPYRGDICTELNNERYFHRKDGQLGFSHPSNTHDDVFWSIALANYATVDMQTFDIETIRFGG